MSVYRVRRPAPLSDRAVRLLRRVIELRDAAGVGPTLGQLEASYGLTRALVESLHVLAGRELVRIADGRVEPRRRGRDLLKTAHYRARGL